MLSAARALIAVLPLTIACADAAIMHMDVPWVLLLEGKSPEEALKRDGTDRSRISI